MTKKREISENSQEFRRFISMLYRQEMPDLSQKERIYGNISPNYAEIEPNIMDLWQKEHKMSDISKNNPRM